MRVEPPRLAGSLLRLIPRPDREFIEGDLEEEYAARAARSRTRAAAWYWRQVLATLPWFGLAAVKRLARAIASPVDLQPRNLAMASLTGDPAPVATACRPAFGSRLIASRPTREKGTLATTFVSAILHAGLISGLVQSTIGPEPVTGPVEVQVVELHHELVEAVPPPPPADDAAPVEADPVVFAVPDHIPVIIPPPGQGRITADHIIEGILATARDSAAERTSGVLHIGEKPSFTPFEIAPAMQNRDEVVRALAREYPPLLRDAGVGGTVDVWIRLDEQGGLIDAQLHTSSGQPSLDEAALRVARIIEFRPAMNRDEPVPVWVSVPITFQVR